MPTRSETSPGFVLPVAWGLGRAAIAVLLDEGQRGNSFTDPSVPGVHGISLRSGAGGGHSPAGDSCRKLGPSCPPRFGLTENGEYVRSLPLVRTGNGFPVRRCRLRGWTAVMVTDPPGTTRFPP